MIFTTKQNRFRSKLFCAILVFLLCFPVFSFTVHANTGTNDEGEASDFSFYNLSSKAATALSDSAADKDDKLGRFSSSTSNTVGGLLGYTDPDERGIKNFIMSALSMGAVTKDYQSLNGSGGTLLAFGEKFEGYIALGATLQDIGIDQTGSAVETVGFFNSRFLIGGITMVAFLFSQSVTMMFSIVLNVLALLNPFQFFKYANTGAGSASSGGWNDSLISITNGTPTLTNGGSIAYTISTLYNYVYIAGFMICSVMFVIFLVRFVMPGKTYNRLGALKNWGIRMLFLMGGIVLLGGTYTNLLTELSGQLSGGNSSSAKVIASTFCDFEAWVLQGMPDPGMELKVRLNSESGSIQDAGTNAQILCYNINQKSASDLDLPDQLFVNGGSNKISPIIETLQTDSGFDKTNSSSTLFGGTATAIDETNAATTRWIYDMLTRYMSGSKITASSYETMWKSKNWDSTVKVDVKQAMADLSSVKSFNTALEGNYSDLFGSSNWNLAPNPFAVGTGNIYGAASSSDIDLSGVSTPPSGTGMPSSYYDPNVNRTLSGLGGFSAMTIYNYLNTKFSSNALTVYSSGNSASDYVKESHYSVNLVGNGLSAFTNWGLCITLLLCYGILGVFYSSGLIMVNIKRGLRLMIAIPGAMLGSLQSIARVVSYTLLMIIEILVNIFLYALTTELLYIVAIEITSQVEAAASSTVGDIGSLASPMFAIVAIIALIWFTKTAVSLRKPIIKSFEEMADNAIQKFITGTSAQEMKQGANGANGFNGAGATAGSAAAGKSKIAKAMDSMPFTSGLAGMALNPTGTAIKSKVDSIDSKNQKKELETRQLGEELIGMRGSSSAVVDETNKDDLTQAKKDNKQLALAKVSKSGEKLAEGGVEIAAGVAAKDPGILAKGAMNVGSGTESLTHVEDDKNKNDINVIQDASAGNGSAKLLPQTTSNSTPPTVSTGSGKMLGETKESDITNKQFVNVNSETVTQQGSNVVNGASNGSTIPPITSMNSTSDVTNTETVMVNKELNKQNGSVSINDSSTGSNVEIPKGKNETINVNDLTTIISNETVTKSFNQSKQDPIDSDDRPS